MDETPIKNTSIHISSKSHLNLYQCGNNEIPPGGKLTVKADDIFTLVYANSGSALLESNGLAYKACASQGLFVFPDMQCELQNVQETPLEITWLSFSGYGIEFYLNRANITRPRPVFSDPEGQVGERLTRIYTAAHKLLNRYCRMVSGLYDIFSILLDMNPTKHGDKYVDSADFFAVKAVKYMRSITVDEIATMLGISPKQYLIAYRIEKACTRLKTSHQSVMKIAESVGYTNQFTSPRSSSG